MTARPPLAPDPLAAERTQWERRTIYIRERYPSVIWKERHTMRKPRMRYCCNCGAELGVLADRDYERTDTCGALECERAMRDMLAEEREEAHRRLDEDMGW